MEKTLKESVLEQHDLQPLAFTAEAVDCSGDLASHLELTVKAVYGSAPAVVVGGHYLVVGEYRLDTPAVEWIVLANSGRMTGYHEFLAPGAGEFTVYAQAQEVAPGTESRLYVRARLREGEDCAVLRVTLGAG